MDGQCIKTNNACRLNKWEFLLRPKVHEPLLHLFTEFYFATVSLAGWNDGLL